MNATPTLPRPLRPRERASSSTIVLVLVAACAFAAGHWSDSVATAAVPDAALARAAAEAAVKLERLRPDIVARCIRPRVGEERVNVTFDLAFDAKGQEVARRISEESSGGRGAIDGCIRRLPGSVLRVSPPGSTVAVTLSASYP